MEYAKSSFWHEATIDHLVAQNAFSRRSLLKLVMAGGTLAVAGTPMTAFAQGGGAASGVKGGTLRIGMNNEPDSLDPHRTPSRYMWMVGLSIYDPLVISDNKANIYPNLAESWQVSPDRLTYTFKLRQDVKFHDGTPFNAQAVKYNYDRVVDPKTGSLLSNDDIGPYESSTVIDDNTVAIKLKQPYGPLLRMLSLMEFAIISPTAAEKEGLDNYGHQPVGTGPFKFVEWIQQDHTKVERNPDYAWGSPKIYPITGPAYLDGIVYQYLTEDQTRIAALEAGEVDAILAVPPTEIERLQGESNLKVEKFPAMGHPTAFILNTKKPPTDDINVRKALSRALNRESINKKLYGGQLQPAYGPISPATFAYWPEVEKINAYDPAEADKLLQASEWKKDGDFYKKNGETLKLEIYTFGTTSTVGEAVQGELKKEGIDSKVTNLDFSQQKEIGYKGLHNATVVTFGSPDPRIMKLLYHSKNMRENGWAWTHFKETNPAEQAKLDAALDAGEQESDPAKRQEQYIEAQRLIVENGLVLAVKNDFQIVAYTTNVQNWQMDDANYHPRPYGVWLKEK